MARCIQKGDFFPVASHHVGPDMLGNASCFPVDYMGIADCIQQRGFPVIYMAHNADHRRTFFHGAFVLGFLFQKLFDHVYLLFHLTNAVEFQGDLLCFLKFDLLIYRYHDSLHK